MYYELHRSTSDDYGPILHVSTGYPARHCFHPPKKPADGAHGSKGLSSQRAASSGFFISGLVFGVKGFGLSMRTATKERCIVRIIRDWFQQSMHECEGKAEMKQQQKKSMNRIPEVFSRRKIETRTSTRQLACSTHGSAQASTFRQERAMSPSQDVLVSFSRSPAYLSH